MAQSKQGEVDYPSINSSSLYLPDPKLPPEEPASLMSIEKTGPGSPARGGFPLAVLVVENKKYSCAICQLLFREPVQSQCGHRFCHSCLSSVSDGTYCALCEKEGEHFLLSPKSFFPDPAIRREMYKQTAQCDNDKCSWHGTFKEYLTHTIKCDYKTITCECGVSVLKSKLEQHRAHDCSLRRIPCNYCSDSVIARDIAQHLNVCTEYRVDCPRMCGRKLPRRELDAHVDPMTGDCDKKPCPFGCEEGGAEHAMSSAPRHVTLLLGMITALQTRASDRDPSPAVRELTTKVSNIEGEVTKLQSKLQSVTLDGRQGQQSLSEQKPTAKVSGFRQYGNRSDIAVAAASMPPEDQGQVYFRSAAEPSPLADEHKTLAALKDKQALVESLAAVLNREVEKLVNDQANLDQQGSTNASSIELLKTKVVALERSLALKDVALAEQELRLKELETTSFDGTLMWPITDFARRRQDAISGRTPSVYSSPFYTSRSGYKMCARIYLNGDGMGKGTHISLFFVIMRGQFDAILPFPFRQKVTMTLMDQNSREHVLDAFRPDPSSSSFRRPVSAMNIASGVPLFCPLSRLEDRKYAYVKDDTFFLKIAVDLNGL